MEVAGGDALKASVASHPLCESRSLHAIGNWLHGSLGVYSGGEQGRDPDSELCWCNQTSDLVLEKPFYPPSCRHLTTRSVYWSQAGNRSGRGALSLEHIGHVEKLMI